jgi:hypothetical protein
MGEKMDIRGILNIRYLASLEILKWGASNVRNHYGMIRESEDKLLIKTRGLPRLFFCFWFFRV